MKSLYDYPDQVMLRSILVKRIINIFRNYFSPYIGIFFCAGEMIIECGVFTE